MGYFWERLLCALRRLASHVGDAVWAVAQPARHRLHVLQRRWAAWHRRRADALWAAGDQLRSSWSKASRRRRTTVAILAALPFLIASGLTAVLLPDGGDPRALPAEVRASSHARAADDGQATKAGDSGDSEARAPAASGSSSGGSGDVAVAGVAASNGGGAAEDSAGSAGGSDDGGGRASDDDGGGGDSGGDSPGRRGLGSPERDRSDSPSPDPAPKAPSRKRAGGGSGGDGGGRRVSSPAPNTVATPAPTQEVAPPPPPPAPEQEEEPTKTSPEPDLDEEEHRGERGDNGGPPPWANEGGKDKPRDADDEDDDDD